MTAEAMYQAIFTAIVVIPITVMVVIPTTAFLIWLWTYTDD